VLGAILALVLSASAAAAQPFPKIKRGHELSCSAARAKLAVTVSWQKANRKGKHRGHAVALIRARGGKIHNRKVKSKRLRSVRSDSIEYRFRFPKRASERLCKGKAKAEVVASHGQNKDRAGLVEIYRVTRKTLGGKASASGDAGAAQVGSDCRGKGPNAIVKEAAQLQGCNISGAELTEANLIGAELSGASFSSASLSGAFLSGASLSFADLSDANLDGAVLQFADLSGTDLSNASLVGAVLFFADLSGANLRGADLALSTVTGADCSGAIGPDGARYPTGSAIQC
jgi:hypothetical protein